MPHFFFLLSGEHPTLPFAELKAVLETENIAYEELQKLPQILRLTASIDAVEALKRRAALTRVCCKEITVCPSSYMEIVETVKSYPIKTLLEPGGTFVVRVRRIGERTNDLTSVDLERKLGKLVLDNVKNVKVNLKKPQATFFGTLTGDTFLFGLKLAEISPTPFMQRRPRKRPFFHPSAMPPKLARCMVNLARAKKGEMLLDPFCGTGSFLIEAGLLGCQVVGFDAKRYMVKGCRRNLKHLSVAWEGLGVADAMHLPLSKADCIVTDPPYGRSASTMGYTTSRIVEDFLADSVEVLERGQRVCLAAPRTIGVGEMAEAAGFRHAESHMVYVHRSLTREVAVLERA